MEISSVRVHLRDSKQESKLRAFVTITLDGVFVVRDLKIIEGKKGLFVAMPTFKIKKPCHECGNQNFLRSQYCSKCGKSLPQEDMNDNKVEEYKEIAHPITREARNYIQDTVLEAYQKELEKSE